MKRDDLLRIIGADEESEYVPVAGMLACGYGFAGYYNARLNKGLDDACVLVNVHLADLRAADEPAARPVISDFADFVEEVVRRNYEAEPKPAIDEEALEQPEETDVLGKSIPLTAIPCDQIAVIYPVAHIGRMMQELHRERKKVPSFLDLDNKSLIIKLLRTKLW